MSAELAFYVTVAAYAVASTLFFVYLAVPKGRRGPAERPLGRWRSPPCSTLFTCAWRASRPMSAR